MSDFIPTNQLEVALQKAQSEGGNFVDFLKLFVTAEVYVPSATDFVKDPQSFRPVLFDKDGEQHMVVFTSAERAQSVAHLGPFGQLSGVRDLIKGMPAGTGLFVNIGQKCGFSMSSAGLKRLAQDVS